ncbi:hypothetical protein SATRM34S_02269 [Streptomyces atroolivaceus]
MARAVGEGDREPSGSLRWCRVVRPPLRRSGLGSRGSSVVKPSFTRSGAEEGAPGRRLSFGFRGPGFGRQVAGQGPAPVRPDGHRHRVARARRGRASASCALPGGRGRSVPVGDAHLLVTCRPRQRMVGRKARGRSHRPGAGARSLRPVGRAPTAHPAGRHHRAPPSIPSQPSPAPEDEQSAGVPKVVAAPSPAYLALAELGRRAPRLALSAADCAALEPFAAAWFARGVSADYLTRRSPPGFPGGSDHLSVWYAAAPPTRCHPGSPRHPRRPRVCPALPCAVSWSNAADPARQALFRTASAAPATPGTGSRSCPTRRPRSKRNAMSPPWSRVSVT